MFVSGGGGGATKSNMIEWGRGVGRYFQELEENYYNLGHIGIIFVVSIFLGII